MAFFLLFSHVHRITHIHAQNYIYLCTHNISKLVNWDIFTLFLSWTHIYFFSYLLIFSLALTHHYTIQKERERSNYYLFIYFLWHFPLCVWPSWLQIKWFYSYNTWAICLCLSKWILPFLPACLYVCILSVSFIEHWVSRETSLVLQVETIS
jgi:hypothetical protein